MKRRAKQTFQESWKLAKSVRWFRLYVTFVFILSLFIPTLMQVNEAKAYALTPEMQNVLGTANKNLSAKFSFNSAKNKWQFNKNGVAALASDIAEQEGGKDVEGIAGALSQLAAKQVGGTGKKDTSLYSVDLPAKAEEGITYYDNITRLSFKMVPQFEARNAKLIDGRVVYPIAGGAKIAFTAQPNGLKEDILLPEYMGDTLRYSYKLELPETLQAQILDDGSIGIYSANPALFGDISFSNDDDRARVMEGRKNGEKNNLVFAIPAPFIKDQKGMAGHTYYDLSHGTLSVVAEGLNGLSYPLTVDPSVTVTSTSNFQEGTNEGNVDFTGDQLSRAGLTGGGVGSAWNAQTAIPGSGTCGADQPAYGVYNGYVYMVDNTFTCYAKLNTNGTINGSWQAGTPPTVNYVNRTGTIYNGYFYITGGSNGVGTVQAATQYIKLNADGTTGASWNTGSTLITARSDHQTVAYNGYLYVAGGQSGTLTYTATIERAAINADGSLGSWTAISDLPNSDNRSQHLMQAYNGYMYVNGGNSSDNCYGVHYARINSDGSLGTWIATSTMPNGVSDPCRLSAHGVYKGYWYVIEGLASGASGSNRTIFAPILGNGALGNWQTTTTAPNGQQGPGFAAYSDYLFILGGQNTQSVYSSPVSTAGATDSYTTETDVIEPTTLRSSGSVVYNGYLYLLGGQNGSAAGTMTNNVYVTSLNSDGSTGAWTTTSAFTQFRSAPAAIAYNGYMYILGGWHNVANTSCSAASDEYCSDVQKAVINSDGTLGAWSSAGGYFTSQPRGALGVAVWEGYMYAFGGGYGAGGSNGTAETRVGQIQSNGDVTGWTSTNNMVNAASDFGYVQSGRYVYALGGRNPTAYNTNVQYAVLSGGTATWSSTTSLLTGVESTHASISNGYVYVVGGKTGGGVNDQTNAVQYARICWSSSTTDGCNGTVGTLGTWRTTKSFAPVRSNNMSAAYNGYLYVMGGCSVWGVLGTCNTTQNDLQYAKINNGGNGALTSWSGTTAMANARHEFESGSFAFNGYLYVMGGFLGISTSPEGQADEIIYAPIQANGTLGSWSNMPAASTPTSLPNSAWLQHNGYVYQIGGKQSATFFDKVEYAAICTGSNTTVQFGANASITDTGDCTTGSTPGIFSAWKTTSSLGTPRGQFGVAAHNGYMYAFAGCTGTNGDFFHACQVRTSTVEVAQIDSTTGAPGTWTTLGASYNVPTARQQHSVVGYGGYVYVIGGCTNASSPAACNQNLSDVRVAKLNGATLAADAGCGGIWCQQNSFVDGRYALSAQAYNGYLYIFGGYSAGGTGVQNDVQYAPITLGGIGKWTRSTNNFTTARSHHATTVYNGNAYIMGGKNNGGAFYNDVQVAGLQSIARIGRYSKLIQVYPTTSIAGVYYNGTLGDGSKVEYKVAPSSGILGAASPATQGTGSEPTPFCGVSDIYYVQLLVTLDDSTRATYGEDTQSNTTDITVYYRLNATPPPNLRLNGGKWFYSEVQQPLDICRL